MSCEPENKYCFTLRHLVFSNFTFFLTNTNWCVQSGKNPDHVRFKAIIQDYISLFLSGGCESVPRGQVLDGPQENQPGRRHAGLGARALWDPPAAGLHVVPPAVPPPGSALQHHGRAVSVPLLSLRSGRAPCWVGSLLQVSESAKEKRFHPLAAQSSPSMSYRCRYRPIPSHLPLNTHHERLSAYLHHSWLYLCTSVRWVCAVTPLVLFPLLNLTLLL